MEFEERITVREVAEAMQIPLSALDRQKQMRIAACLKELGFARKHSRRGWRWERGG